MFWVWVQDHCTKTLGMRVRVRMHLSVFRVLVCSSVATQRARPQAATKSRQPDDPLKSYLVKDTHIRKQVEE